MTTNDKPVDQASLTHRIAAEIADSFDEELEMELDDGRLDEVIAEHGEHPTQSAVERHLYFKELFRLQAELVKLRYFAGMTIEEAALALGISAPTAKRWWTFARTWLYQEIRVE